VLVLVDFYVSRLGVKYLKKEIFELSKGEASDGQRDGLLRIVGVVKN